MVKLSTRPEKRVGTDAMWDHAEAVMTRVLEEIKARHGNVVTTALNPGEGAFYGPKFEYVLRDAIGRDWQCGTTQVDFNLPERFGAFYIARQQREDDAGDDASRDLRLDGALHRHPARALRGPPAAVACAGADRRLHDHQRRRRRRASSSRRRRKKRGLRVETDLRNEKINYKVREHSLAKVPVLIALGRKEASENTVSLRRLGSNAQTAMRVEEAIDALAAEAVPPDLRASAPDCRGSARLGESVLGKRRDIGRTRFGRASQPDRRSRTWASTSWSTARTTGRGSPMMNVPSTPASATKRARR